MKPGLFSISYIQEILNSPRLKPLTQRIHPTLLLTVAKKVFDDFSREFRSAATEWRRPELAELVDKVFYRLQDALQTAPGLTVNGTGTVFPSFSTGRELWAPSVVEDMMWEIVGEKNEGDFIDRTTLENRITMILCRLTDAEDAMIFANPELANLAVLQSITPEREIVVARRDFYEKKNQTRLENLLQIFGNPRREVGAVNALTNEDYLDACNSHTGIIWMAFGQHSSRFYTRQKLASLREKSEQLQFPIFCELDFAPLIDLSSYFYEPLPTLADHIATGYDLIQCNGGQLIGGPDCGILLGTKAAIQRVRSAIFQRYTGAHRVVLTGLLKTLNLYQDADALTSIPILQTLSTPLANLKNRAERLLPQLAASPKITDLSIVEGNAELFPKSQLGTMPSWLIQMRPVSGTPQELAATLENQSPTLKVNFNPEKLFLNMKTISPAYDSLIPEIFENL